MGDIKEKLFTVVGAPLPAVRPTTIRGPGPEIYLLGHELVHDGSTIRNPVATPLVTIHSGRVLIRRETPADSDAIRATTTAAFAQPGQPGQVPPEAGLIDELRSSQAWLPALSLVATQLDGEVIDHVLCTRGHVGAAAALALGPISVQPDHQGHGVGSALMHAVLGAADALGEPLVALLGHPSYYQRFGFCPSTEYDIAPPVPEWRPHFQVRVLTEYASLRGTFIYPAPFDSL